jgi:hypothetical protein
MAFPALIPSSRSYAAGDYPHTTHATMNGGEVRVRHSNEPVGASLQLSFLAATTATLELVIAHYGATIGNFYSFTLPAEVFSGADDDEAFTPAGHRWVYESIPTVADIPISGSTPSNLHDITVSLRSVPPETIVALGARLRVNISVVGGFAYDADAYWSSWVEQNHGWYSESYATWWAN